MKLIDYLIYALPVPILVMLSAIAGTFYLKKAPASSVWIKAFVYYLWFTLIVEVFATYAVLGHFSEYRYLPMIEDTNFERNYWVFNIHIALSFPFLIIYFSSYVKSILTKRFFKFLALGLFLGIIAHYSTSSIFFEGYSPYVDFVGTFFLFMSIVVFYFEVLRSEYILKLKHFLPFYFSLGTLIFYLCVTPLSIFSKYFSTGSGNTPFVELQVNVILFSNIFMYSCFILGFLVCSRKNKSY